MPRAPLHPSLRPIPLSSHIFRHPEKRINSQADLDHFPASPGYTRISAFLNLLNICVSPLALSLQQQQTSSDLAFAVPPISPDKVYTNSPSILISQPVQRIIDLVTELGDIIKECPPDTGPRRFGNVAFRTWHKVVEERISGLLDKSLPQGITSHKPASGTSAVSELTSYLMGSFGSAQRLDYGTGHELSFLAFICGIWLLGGFEPGRDEQAIALRLMDAYLHLIRNLVKTYTLEPAGSHGVWGLDDHFFLPYIFGSAQLTTQAPQPGVEPDYASVGVPRPAEVTKRDTVDKWREKNLYFGAVGFIYDVKKGPFWEHSPILFDISGVTEGWGKINIGMIKMFNAEVLGKFPVVQHFHFGSLFSWTATPQYSESSTTPSSTVAESAHGSTASTSSQVPTRAPWAKPATVPTGDFNSHGMDAATTRAPWAKGPATHLGANSRVPNLHQNQPHAPAPMGGFTPTDGGPVTKAPWAK